MGMQSTGVILLSMMMMAGTQGAVAAVSVTKADFGKLSDGRAAEAYTLKNSDLEVELTNYGARIVSLKTKDRNGQMGELVQWLRPASVHVIGSPTRSAVRSIAPSHRSLVPSDR